jgi:ABC-2 type transport system ATP-binding protein
MPAIEVHGLVKQYGSFTALHGIEFEVDEGEVFALLGPNGAGKTSTLEILEGFRRPSAGSVRVLDMDPQNGGREFREHIGVVLQGTAVEPYLTVHEVLTRNTAYYPHPRDVDEVIQLVGLEGRRSEMVRNLSGGQQRRLDVALGIIGRPRLLFLDEPTTGFDPSARRDAWGLVRELSEAGTTILLTTHYMEEAQHLADRVAVIAGGRIVATGTPETLGGRETATARIAFRLPEAIAATSLPFPVTHVEGDQVEIRTEDDIAVLHRLTNWSLTRKVPLTGLTVQRPTLEDVYLALVADVEEGEKLND